MADDRGAVARLDNWKAIASYLGKDPRTAKRWESDRGLPVHRAPGGGRAAVYAFTSELDEWLRTGRRFEAADGAAPARAGRINPIALALAIAIAPALVALFAFWPAAPQAQHVPPPQAEQLYLEATYLWEKRTGDSLRDARGLLERAVSLDPRYADAYVALANTHNLLREYTTTPARESYAAAADAARRAVELDPRNGEALSALAFAEFYGLRQVEAGLGRFEAALRLDPNSSKGHHWLGNALLHLGRFAEGLGHLQRARELEPKSRAIVSSYGLALFLNGRTGEAVRTLTDLAAREPDFLSPHTYLTYVYLAEGRGAEYLDELATVGRMRGDSSRDPVVAAGRAGLAEGGWPGMLAAMLAAERDLAAAGNSSAYNVARFEALSGKAVDAVSGLEAALAADDEMVMAIHIDPAFRPIADTTPFRAFVGKVGL